MPEILLFDDSFSALDYVTEANLRKNLSNLNYDPTVIIVAQRISSVIGVDKIIVLDNGKIAGIGSHEELLNNCKEYREIFESQDGYIESNEGGMYEN
jgi:ATP-binding cassette subfamily B protein